MDVLDDEDLQSMVDNLVSRHGIKAVVAAIKIHQVKKSGRPATRRKYIMESEEFLVWVTVEQYKHAHPKASDDEACRKIAEAGGVGYFAVSGENQLSFDKIYDNPRGIARLLSEAKKKRRDDHNLASAWNRHLDTLLGRPHAPEDLLPRLFAQK